MGLTSVISINKAQMDCLHVASQNWRVHCPELFRWPMVVMYDLGEIDIPVETQYALDHPDVTFCPWVPYRESDNINWFGWRHRLDSALLYGAAYQVKTDRFVMLSPSIWMDPLSYCSGWVQPDGDVFVLSDRRKGMTDWNEVWDSLDSWRLQVGFSGDSSLGPIGRGDVRSHERSWIIFGNTSVARYAASLLVDMDLPVDSVHSFLCYICERAGLDFRSLPMASFGWNRAARVENLREKVLGSL